MQDDADVTPNLSSAASNRRMQELGDAARRMGHQLMGAILPIGALIEYVEQNDELDRAMAAKRARPARSACDYLTHLGRGLQLLKSESSTPQGGAVSTDLVALMETMTPILELVLAPRVRLECTAGSQELRVPITPPNLASMLFDAVIAARDARDGRGSVMISMERGDGVATLFVTARTTDSESGAAAPMRSDDAITNLKQLALTMQAQVAGETPSYFQLTFPLASA